MRQLILFLAKYRSTLLLIVFVLIALLRHSLKNPVAEHRLNSIGFGAVASVQNGLSGWKQYWRLDAINEELARENAALRSGSKGVAAGLFPNFNAYDLFLRGSLNTLTTNGTITSLFMRVVKTEYSQEWAR